MTQPSTPCDDGKLSLAQRIENVFSFLYAEKPDDNCYFDRALLDEIKAAALRGAASSERKAMFEAEGYALAARVLQSDLYEKLDDKERAECDEFLKRGLKA
jgi:hypothetical protein